MNKGSESVGAFQPTDKPCKRKNSFRQKKSGRNFCLQRQQHLQSAVTYVCVSSLDCKFASLPCEVFQRLQIVDKVNDLKGSESVGAFVY